MQGGDFLTDYMQEYSDDYILIGGNACALNFEDNGATFRATIDLDIVLITESTNDHFYLHLWGFLLEHNYQGKVFKGSNAGGCAYRFILPEEYRNDELPVQIELFSRKPEYFDAALAKKGKEHVTPIHTGETISNLSAILLDDEVYDFILASKLTIKKISTVNLECLFGLKSVAWHSNQKLFDEGKITDLTTVLKHPLDMIRIVSVIPDPQEKQFPAQIFDSISLSHSKFSDADVRSTLQAAEADIDLTIDFIDMFVKEQTS